MFAAVLWVLFGEGIIVRSQSLLPETVGYLLVLATLLGEPWIFVILLSGALWFGDARRIAPLFGFVFGGLALVLVLKSVVGLPRPATGPLLAVDAVHPAVRWGYTWAIGGSGYGFPSGHVAGATIAWGGLATATSVWTWQHRWFVASSIVAMVALSRVLLGVHYLGDVLGGLGIGIAVIGCYRFLVRNEIAPAVIALGSGVVVAVAAMSVSSTDSEPYLAAGALLGGLISWIVFADHTASLPRNSRGITHAVLGTVAVLIAGGSVVVAVPGRAGIVAAAGAMGLFILAWPTFVGVLVPGNRRQLGS